MVSFFMCSVATVALVLSDWGKQEHVLSPVQRFMIKHIDTFFKVSEDDIHKQIVINVGQLEADKLKLTNVSPKDQSSE